MDDTFHPDLTGDIDSARLNALSLLGAALSSGHQPLEGLRLSLSLLEATLAKNYHLKLSLDDRQSAFTCSQWQFPVECTKDVTTPETEIVAVLEVRPVQDPSPYRMDEADRLFLEAVTRLTALHCRLAWAHGELERRETVARDIQLAIELQRSLQPGSDPDTIPIWGVNRPVRQVSGDFFDFYRAKQGHYLFALGDVSGKGVGAALLMAKTISLFRCLSKRIDTPGALLAAINSELCETATRGMFVSMVAGRYDPASGRLRFANAGHVPPLVRRKDRSYDTYPADAPPLGILPNLGPDDEEIDLDGGEFYVFSDGLTEYRYASGEQLGVDGLIQLVEVFSGDPPARRLEALIQLLDEETGWEARDDLTVLTIDDSWVRPADTPHCREAV